MDEIARKPSKIDEPVVAKKASKIQAEAAWLTGITDMRKLMTLGNCTAQTIQRWVEEWRDDRLAALATLRLRSMNLVVTEVEVGEHSKHLKTLRRLVSRTKEDLDSCIKLDEKLENIVTMLGNHPDFETTDFKQVCSAIKAFGTARDQRSKLQKDYLTVSEQLLRETGFRAYHDAAGARLKKAEVMRGQRDVESEKSPDEEIKDAKPSGDFFDV